MISLEVLTLLFEVASIDLKLHMEKTMGMEWKRRKLPPPEHDLFEVQRKHLLEDFQDPDGNRTVTEIGILIHESYPRKWYRIFTYYYAKFWEKQYKSKRWVPYYQVPDCHRWGYFDFQLEIVTETDHPTERYVYFDDNDNPIEKNPYDDFLGDAYTLFIHQAHIVHEKSVRESIIMNDETTYRPWRDITYDLDKKNLSLISYSCTIPSLSP